MIVAWGCFVAQGLFSEYCYPPTYLLFKGPEVGSYYELVKRSIRGFWYCWDWDNGSGALMGILFVMERSDVFYHLFFSDLLVDFNSFLNLNSKW